MIETNEVFEEMGSGVFEIVKQAAGQYVAQANQDVKAFLDGAKLVVAEWAQELNAGKMSKDQFEFLAAGRLGDLAQLNALAQAGIAAATIDATRARIVDFMITAISARIG